MKGAVGGPASRITSEAMASATVLTLTKIDANSEIVTSVAAQIGMSSRNIGSANRLSISGRR